MILAANGIAHDDDPEIVGRDAGHLKRYQLCDRIIFAIACAGGEGDQWRTPDVGLAVLSKVAHRPDRQIDGPIDLAEPGASLPRPRIVDDGEEPKGRWRRAARTVAVAKGKLHSFITE